MREILSRFQNRFCSDSFNEVPSLPGLLLFSTIPFCVLVEESWWFWSLWYCLFLFSLRSPLTQDTRSMVVWFVVGLGVSAWCYRFLAAIDLLFWGRMLLFLLLGFVRLPKTRPRILAMLFISFVLVLIASSLTYQFWLAFYLPLYFWAVLDCVMSLELNGVSKAKRRLPRGLSLRITLCAMLLSYLSFLLFPRINVSRFPGSSQISGFSDSIEFGEMTNLLQSDQLILRVYASQSVWIRGAVLDLFDGVRWQNSQEYFPVRSRVNTPVNVRPVLLDPELTVVAVEVLPTRQIQLFVPAEAVTVTHGEPLSIDAHRSLRRRPQVYAVPYRLEAQVSRGPVVATLEERELPSYLQLPQQSMERIRLLAKEIVAQTQNVAQVVTKLEEWFHNNFRYTLQSEHGDDPMTSFLFVSREGHCEYFASAMVLMLRTLGYKARVVTGFLPGELNPIGGYYSVRGSDAHAWVEVLDDSGNWIRADPTTARSEGFLEAWFRMPILRGLSHWVEFLDMRWQSWVLYFNRLDQLLILRMLWQWVLSNPLLSLLGFLGIGLLVFACVSWLPRFLANQRLDPYLARLDKLLLAQGWKRMPGQQPASIALNHSNIRVNEELRKFQDLLYCLRFADRDVNMELDDCLKRLHQELSEPGR